MFSKFIRKGLFIYARLRYPSVERYYLYFIRDNYYSRLRQTKYILKDYVKKTPYKTVEYHGEFDQEFRYALPFAYWHYKNGTLKKTVSYSDTKHFYYFSQEHVERPGVRDWKRAYSNFEIPNMTHSIKFSYKKWIPVPFKEYYKNDLFLFKKPTLVIANKFNIEWDHQPINFYSLETLKMLIDLLQDKFQIVYNRPLGKHIVMDNSELLDLGDYEFLEKNYPNVILMSDLMKQYHDTVDGSFNLLQLKVYANCNHFITVHGGTSTFATCFGGQNIFLSKKGLEHDLKVFETIIPRLSTGKIYHAKSEDEVLNLVKQHYFE